MKYLVALAFAAGAFVVNSPVAQADPTSSMYAAKSVCDEIAAWPTADEVSQIVYNELPRIYTPDQADEIMYDAMNVVCPVYKPLAVEAVLNIARSRAT